MLSVHYRRTIPERKDMAWLNEGAQVIESGCSRYLSTNVHEDEPYIINHVKSTIVHTRCQNMLMSVKRNKLLLRLPNSWRLFVVKCLSGHPEKSFLSTNVIYSYRFLGTECTRVVVCQDKLNFAKCARLAEISQPTSTNVKQTRPTEAEIPFCFPCKQMNSSTSVSRFSKVPW